MGKPITKYKPDNTVVLKATRGIEFRVSESDIDLIAPHKWQAEQHVGRVYIGTSIKQPSGKWKRYRLHRHLMDAKKGEIIDHIDGDTLNNTRNNLRIVDRSVNSRNRRATGVSRYLGVSWSGSHKKWQATIKFGQRYYNLGRYTVEWDAAMAYNCAAWNIPGARLNETKR